MNLTDFSGIAVILIFLFIMLTYTIYFRRQQAPALRSIPAYQKIERAIGLAIEAGNRLHIALGSGNLISPQSGIGFLGLSLLGQISKTAVLSDHPPITSAGEGAMIILAQNIQRIAAQKSGGYFDPSFGRITGLTPFAYSAGASLLVSEENVGASLLFGTFRSESALLLEATERNDSEPLGGTDDITGQAVMYVSTREPLIGEETFAAGAYLGADEFHKASLFAQDTLRWILIGFILVGALLKITGIL